MKILHTESSNGWGGQEMRILNEAMGMRKRGHQVFFAIVRGGKFVARAKEQGFEVVEVSFKKKSAFSTIPTLLKMCKIWGIDLINTHSSGDAWIAGVAGRLAGVKIIRTRHLSTPVRAGINSRILYRKLLDYLVTTSSAIIPKICAQSGLDKSFAKCIATGVNPELLQVDRAEVSSFRKSIGVKPEECLVGTLCFLRSWKGIEEVIQAAALLKKEQNIRWVIVGGGRVEYFQEVAKRYHVDDLIHFTGHIENPLSALASMDIFLLLSTKNEGISQASLQAAYLEKPLITTDVGGLPEVSIEGKTGYVVPPHAPDRVAAAILQLSSDPNLRVGMGKAGKRLVEEKYTITDTLDQMEEIYHELC